MELYSMGLNIAPQSPSFQSRNAGALRVFEQAPEIKTVWASWCDLILALPSWDTSTGAVQSDIPPLSRLAYYGTSLTHEQAQYIGNLEYDSKNPLVFFGRAIDHGVSGVIIPASRKITFFGTDPETKKGIKDPTTTVSFKADNWDITDLKFTSGNAALISARMKTNMTLSGGTVAYMPSLDHLIESLCSSDSGGLLQRLFYNHKLCEFAPTQWCTNATTLTALDKDGKIYTYATDRRFPKCLGRPFDTQIVPGQQDHLQPIRYFEDSEIVKIASGGYYSAAITDGELYVWGQAIPSSDHNSRRELTVLKRRPVDGEDEFVRCVELTIQDRMATVTDVSIGWGHILVAAQAVGDRGEILRAVFGAGENGKDQLGIPISNKANFVEDFTEVTAFRDKVIKDIICAGWSSHIIVHKD